MDKRIEDLFERMSKKGFMPIEIQGIVNDALNILNTSGDWSIKTVDRELEELGWGFGVMDRDLFELIASLAKNRSSYDLWRMDQYR